MARTVSDIRECLRYWHDERGLKWREIAELPDFRGITPGTLNAIEKHGREPKDPIVRERLGMARLETCGQCHTFNRFIRKATRRPTVWRDVPVRSLEIALRNREEMR